MRACILVLNWQVGISFDELLPPNPEPIGGVVVENEGISWTVTWSRARDHSCFQLAAKSYLKHVINLVVGDMSRLS